MTETVMSKEVLKALDAKHIVPLVAYLCHESSVKSGGVFELGGGWISELRWQRSNGVGFNLPFTPEDVSKHFDEICNFDKDFEFPDATSDAMPKMIQNFERNGGKLEPNKVSKVTLKSAAIFDMLGAYLGQKEGSEAVHKCGALYNFNITERKNGPVMGKWGLDLKNGDGCVYNKHFNNADATFTLDDEEFFNECMRTSNPQMAFLKGRMKIKGSMKKASTFVPDLFPMPTQENLVKYSSAKL